MNSFVSLTNFIRMYPHGDIFLAGLLILIYARIFAQEFFNS